MLTSSLSQLKMVQGKLQESQESLSSINTESKSKEILVPLTGSVSFTVRVHIDWQFEVQSSAILMLLHDCCWYQHLGINH